MVSVTDASYQTLAFNRDSTKDVNSLAHDSHSQSNIPGLPINRLSKCCEEIGNLRSKLSASIKTISSLTKEGEQLRTELKSLKAKFQQEKEELGRENADLKAQIEVLKHDKEAIQSDLSYYIYKEKDTDEEAVHVVQERDTDEEAVQVVQERNTDEEAVPVVQERDTDEESVQSDSIGLKNRTHKTQFEMDLLREKGSATDYDSESETDLPPPKEQYTTKGKRKAIVTKPRISRGPRITKLGEKTVPKRKATNVLSATAISETEVQEKEEGAAEGPTREKRGKLQQPSFEAGETVTAYWKDVRKDLTKWYEETTILKKEANGHFYVLYKDGTQATIPAKWIQRA